MSFFRLIEGVIKIKRPTAPIGYASFDSVEGVATDKLFDFSGIRKDVHLETDVEITIRLNTLASPTVTIAAGTWDWTDEYVSKMYITFTQSTQLRIYANG